MDARGATDRPWPPTKYLEYEATIETNMGPAKVWTDAGWAFLKPMASDVNPHGLAIELVCTRLAHWFGLPTLDTCVLRLGAADTFPRKKPREPGAVAATCLPGPAFCTRAVDATRWDGTAETLAKIANKKDIARLVIFDTWIRNDDRYPPCDSAGALQSRWRPNLGNVLLVGALPPPRKPKLIAMDFGRAIVGEGTLPPQGFGIAKDKDEWVYGLYPEFKRHIGPSLVDAAVDRLKALDSATVESFVAEIPREWSVNAACQSALAGHLYRRAVYIADTIKERLVPLCDPQGWMPRP